MDNELQHYAVVGMKWGVHRARKKAARVEKLKKKALTNEVKAEKNARRAERAHARYDLGRSNRSATAAARNRMKAAKLDRKALKADNDYTAARLNRKARKLEYRATRQQAKADILSKSTGYGPRSMRWVMRSHQFAQKAARARYRLANDEYYIKTLQKKMSEISNEDLQGAYRFVDDYLRNG